VNSKTLPRKNLCLVESRLSAHGEQKTLFKDKGKKGVDKGGKLGIIQGATSVRKGVGFQKTHRLKKETPEECKERKKKKSQGEGKGKKGGKSGFRGI